MRVMYTDRGMQANSDLIERDFATPTFLLDWLTPLPLLDCFTIDKNMMPSRTRVAFCLLRPNPQSSVYGSGI